MTPKEREKMMWDKIENIEALLEKLLKKIDSKGGNSVKAKK